MENYTIFLDLAIILLFAKLFGIVATKIGVPSVVGEIIAGIVIGPTILNLVGPSDFLIEMAEIGVILLMFLAGLETDLNELKKVGWTSALIAIFGVMVPLIGGAWLYIEFYKVPFYDSVELLKALFLGCVLTATSVSITVQVLREMGKLRGKTGTAIMGAAIIDDVIGIVLLTFILGITNINMATNLLLGMLAGGGIFLVIALLGGLIAGKEAMGFGDVKLMGALGLFFGLNSTILISVLAFLLGAIIGIILIIAKKNKANNYIPFGPFIVMATIIKIFVPFNVLFTILMKIFSLGLY